MTFDINKFTSGGGQSSRGVTQQVFLYLSKTDTLATIQTAGYFNNATSKIDVDDIIFVKGSDGTLVIEVSVVPTIGDVEVIEGYEGTSGATLPIKLTSDVSEILPFANGGAGGISNNRIPFGSLGVLTDNTNLRVSTISQFRLGIGGSPNKRLEVITNTSTDGMRVRTTGSSHIGQIEIDASSSAVYIADRGFASSDAVIQYKTANSPTAPGILDWTVGMVAGGSDYKVLNSGRGSAPDFRIADSNGNASFGLPTDANAALVVNRTSGTCAIEARVGVSGISEVSSISGSDARVIIDRGENTKESLLHYKSSGSTMWVAGVTGTSDYELKNGAGGGIVFKLKTNGNFGFNSENFAGGVKVMAIANASSEPTSNPAGGVVLYSFGGVLKVRDGTGLNKTVQVV